MKSTLAIVAINLAVLAGIVVGYWPNLDFALALESSPLAWQQSSLLVASAMVAGLIASLPSASLREPRIWAFTACALVVAGLDERFMGHEWLQDQLFYRLLNGNPAWQGWAAGITALYGLAGLVIVHQLWPELCLAARKLCLLGLLIGLVAIAMDIAFDSVPIQMIEESLEVLAETCFLSGLFREASRRASLPS